MTGCKRVGRVTVSMRHGPEPEARTLYATALSAARFPSTPRHRILRAHDGVCPCPGGVQGEPRGH